MEKGKAYELSIKNDINDNTDENVKAHRPDFSGNSKGEVADVMVVWHYYEPNVAYLELKKRSGVDEGNRKVVMSGSSDGQNGIEELEELIDESPPWTKQYVVYKFQNRAPLIFHAPTLLDYLRDDDYEGTVEEWHGARLTRGGNISIIKPELSYWQSSTAANDDYKEICDYLGVPN